MRTVMERAAWKPDWASRPVGRGCKAGAAYFPRANGTKPSRLGIFTLGSVCGSMVSASPITPLRFRR